MESVRTQEHEQWFVEAANIARSGLCLRAKCGAVIVRAGQVIGKGYNGPPRDNLSDLRCDDDIYDRAKKPKYDLTCCVHAEWRAIIDGLTEAGGDLKGTTLYYTRLDPSGSRKYSGQPFCTVCSRLALDAGVSFFALWHKDGVVLYDTKEYNDRSYLFHRKD